MKKHSELITIQGLVQGVGFRPMVWQLAKDFGILGEVRNTSSGISILAQAGPKQITKFIAAINDHQPPLSQIKNVSRQSFDAAPDYIDFSIQSSQSGNANTAVIADAATCPQCIEEINDPASHRYQHAFSNCTHCGPRISIVKKIPYDRVNTSMASFPMCEKCAAEYADPGNRRFHAQPTCCPDCGPQLSLVTADHEIVATLDCIGKTAELINAGAIVAIKGVGGFQLACLANNDAAVKRLRSRKNRPHKPLALMAASIRQIQENCRVNEAEAALLQSPAAPIVLLDKLDGSDASPDIAPAQKRLGFMLPNNPLHHLLLKQLDGAIVLTSGNASNEPQCITNQQALDKLCEIADYFLMHDRDIVNRMDDSVLQANAGTVQFLRRARGYAPKPLALPDSLQNSSSVLACGAHLKNTIALSDGFEVILSQHIGDLDNSLVVDDFANTVQLYQQLFEFDVGIVAVDQHGDYHSTRYGDDYAKQKQIPVIRVQHHHAHIAACLADNQWPMGEPVLGIAMDGIGLGEDGHLWGGEFLLADYLGFERLASLLQVPLAGGDRASVEPWRNTLAQLKTVGLWHEAEQLLQAVLTDKGTTSLPVEQLGRAIDSGYAFPQTTSCGRLFDAVAAMLGICPASMSYEGQAASELEKLASGFNLQEVSPYAFGWQADDLPRLDPTPMWQQLLQDLRQGVDSSLISARFHAGLAKAIVDSASRLASERGLATVALSGGVFQNRCLTKRCLELFNETRLRVLQHRNVPCNDGGIAFGQAAVAAANNLEKH